MAPAELSIEVVFSPSPREIRRVVLALPLDATVAEVLAACGWDDLPAPVDAHVGIWGRRATLATLLKDGDRVEVYRALTVDPKEARRVRYRAHGEKLPKGYKRPKSGAKDMTKA